LQSAHDQVSGLGHSGTKGLACATPVLGLPLAAIQRGVESLDTTVLPYRIVDWPSEMNIFLSSD